MIGKKILSYEIKSLLGEGGMGNVYMAVHITSGEKVAIKSLLPQLMRHDHIRERFKMEAEAISLLPHPNIVKLIAYKEDGVSAYIIMEYVEGKDLSKYIKTETGPMPEEMAIRLMKQILDAIAFIHDHQVVHRDIKPSNILVTNDGQIKIIDFGIAKVLSEDDRKLTKTGLQMGAVFYMSPEQVKGKVVDRRSDIYSLGVTFFQMVTGQSPYLSITTEYEVYTKIVNDPLPSARSIYPGAVLQFDEVIAKATAKDPNQRYDDCSQFSNALSDLANRAFEDNRDLIGSEDSTTGKQKIKTDPKKKTNANLIVYIALAVVLLSLVVWQINLRTEYQRLLVKGKERFDTQLYGSAALTYHEASEKRKSLLWGQGEDVTLSLMNDCYFEMYKKEGEDSLKSDPFTIVPTDDNKNTAIKAFKKAQLFRRDDEFIDKRIKLCERINKAVNFIKNNDYSHAVSTYNDAIEYANLIGEDKVVINHLYDAKTLVMAPKSKFKSILIDFDKYEYGKKGMQIHFKVETYFLKYEKCSLTIWFYNESNYPLKDKNDLYSSTDGQVATAASFYPTYEPLNEVTIFFPYDELEIEVSGTYKFKAGIFFNHKQIGDSSDFQSFTYTVK